MTHSIMSTISEMDIKDRRKLFEILCELTREEVYGKSPIKQETGSDHIGNVRISRKTECVIDNEQIGNYILKSKRDRQSDQNDKGLNKSN